MSNTVYDILNKIQRWLPALAAFYIGLCKVWGLPYGTEIEGTILLVATFLAATLEVASGKFYKENELRIIRKD